MELYIVEGLVLLFPVILFIMGFVLCRHEGIVKLLGFSWIIAGILSMIVTVFIVLSNNRIDLILGNLIVQVLLLLITTMIFQIKIIRRK